MCITCGCSGMVPGLMDNDERPVVIQAQIRTSTASSAATRPSYVPSSKVDGSSVTKTDGSKVKGFTTPTPYGKGN